jgi:hypothetical protein
MGGWNQLQSAAIIDGNFASVILSPVNPVSTNLTLQEYELAIPSNAIIQGIELRITRKSSGGDIVDDLVRLVGAGGEVGASRTLGTWPKDGTSTTYGGPTETWGAAPTPAMLNDDAFGVRVRARFVKSSGNDTALFDGVQLKVYYCQ